MSKIKFQMIQCVLLVALASKYDAAPISDPRFGAKELLLLSLLGNQGQIGGGGIGGSSGGAVHNLLYSGLLGSYGNIGSPNNYGGGIGSNVYDEILFPHIPLDQNGNSTFISSNETGGSFSPLPFPGELIPLGESMLPFDGNDYSSFSSDYFQPFNGLLQENGSPFGGGSLGCEPPRIIFGFSRPQKGKYFIGDVVFYSCQYGYRLSGSRSSRCIMGGQWSGSPPFCLHEGNIQSTNNLHSYNPTTSSHDYGSTLPLYENLALTNNFHGNDFLSQNNHVGYNYYCFKPEKPQHLIDDKPRKSHLSVGETMKLSCTSGYVLNGDSYCSCVNVNTWNCTQPTCQKVTCRPPNLQPNSLISIGQKPSYIGGDKVEYKCNDKYIMKGNQVSICANDGSWSSPEPVCFRVTCETPKLAANLYVAGAKKQNYEAMEVITFVCAPGMRPMGSYFSLCSDDGTWTNPPPICQAQEKLCPRPSAGGNTHVITPGDHFRSGDKVRYACRSGIRMIGNPTPTCLPSGTWSDIPPTCV